MISTRVKVSYSIVAGLGILLGIAGIAVFFMANGAIQECVGCLLGGLGIAMMRLGMAELHHAEMKDIAKRQLAVSEYLVKLQKGGH